MFNRRIVRGEEGTVVYYSPDRHYVDPADMANFFREVMEDVYERDVERAVVEARPAARRANRETVLDGCSAALKEMKERSQIYQEMLREPGSETAAMIALENSGAPFMGGGAGWVADIGARSRRSYEILNEVPPRIDIDYSSFE